MRVAIIGGGLQGVEAVYLAQKAGWHATLIDRRPGTPASGLCDDFVQCDVTAAARLDAALADVDLVLPALEDSDALKSLTRWARDTGTPFAFDADAYAVSSSKAASNRLFEGLRLPMPLPWPACGLPVVVKPSAGSGSRQVRLLTETAQLQTFFPGGRISEQWVLQEYLPGPMHSLEVIGFKNQYQALQVTDLAMDAVFDCKRVLAPSQLPADLVAALERMALTVAGAIDLTGIMDIEVVRCGSTLKILEIDARLPSQTPLTVFGSSGLNMVEILGDLFCGRRKACPPPPAPLRGAILEHVRLSAGLLEIGGEHFMATGGPLHRERDFFGADEAITNRKPGQADWVAALIINADDLAAAWRKRNRVIERIMRHYSVRQYLDFEPVSVDSNRLN